MSIVVVLVSMYLAGVLMNAIQIARTYRAVDGNFIGVYGFLYAFFFVLIRPSACIRGTIRSISNWNWLEGRIAKGEDGRFITINKE